MTKPRSERLPHPAKVQHELDRLMVRAATLYDLAKDLGEEYATAYAAGLSQTATGEITTMGRGHVETDPTGQTATNGRLHQLKWRTTKASRKAQHAAADLVEALSLLSAGFNIALDDEEWARWLEKKVAGEL